MIHLASPSQHIAIVISFGKSTKCTNCKTYQIQATTYLADSAFVYSSKHFERSQTTGFARCYCAYSGPNALYQTLICHSPTARQDSHSHNTCPYSHRWAEDSSWPIPYSQTPATEQIGGSYSPVLGFSVSSCYLCFQKRHTRRDQPMTFADRLYQTPVVVSSVIENRENQHFGVRLPVRLHPHYPAPLQSQTRESQPPGLARVGPSRSSAARRLSSH